MTEDRDQAIRERAYAIWEREGCPAGLAEDHWRRAAQELAPARGAAPPAATNGAARPLPRNKVGESPAPRAKAAAKAAADRRPAPARKRRPAAAPAEG